MENSGENLELGSEEEMGGRGEAKPGPARTAASERLAQRPLLLSSLRSQAFPTDRRVSGQPSRRGYRKSLTKTRASSRQPVSPKEPGAPAALPGWAPGEEEVRCQLLCVYIPRPPGPGSLLRLVPGCEDEAVQCHPLGLAAQHR